MSKITNDSLTRSGTGCFIAVPIRQQWVSKMVKYYACPSVRCYAVSINCLISTVLSHGRLCLTGFISALHLFVSVSISVPL